MILFQNYVPAFKEIPGLFSLLTSLIIFIVFCNANVIKVNDNIEETKWPSDGALVVLGGCLFGPGAGCNGAVADVEVLAAPESLPENCTKPPKLSHTSFSHATVFFNNTMITCGGYKLKEECLSWRPGAKQWTVEHFLTTMMTNPYSVVTSTGAWFLDFGDEVSNILRHSDTDGRFSNGPKPSVRSRSFPCVTSLSGDSIVVIGGYMYDGYNSTVEMYDANMTFRRYLPELNIPRQRHSCGSTGTFLVVAGGLTLAGSITDTIEVLDLASNEGWIFLPSLNNGIFDGVMANLFGSLIIIGGTEDIITDTDGKNLEFGHNTSITNDIFSNPFQNSTKVGTVANRELGHAVVPIKISELCNKT